MTQYTYTLFGPEQTANIPESVTEITIRYNYYLTLNPGDIPNHITHLNLMNVFNKPLLKNMIPNSVIYLVLDCLLYHAIEPGIIPDSVKYLTIGYNCRIPIAIPNSVSYLTISNPYESIINNLPNTIKIIKFTGNIYCDCFNLPVSLEQIIIKTTDFMFRIKAPFGCIITDKRGNIFTV